MSDIVDLATQVYPIARAVAAQPAARNISYSGLCARLTGRWQGLHCRDRRLNSALGYLVRRCRAAGLPAISSVVINHDLGYPGASYYPVAHPEAGDDRDLQLVAWGRECTAAHSANYPAAIP